MVVGAKIMVVDKEQLKNADTETILESLGFIKAEIEDNMYLKTWRMSDLLRCARELYEELERRKKFMD